MKNIILFIFLSSLTVGCNKESQTDRFQISVSTDGRIFRIDKRTGDIWEVAPETIKKIEEGKIIMLEPDTYYKTEDEGVVRYLGGGKFEKRKTLSEYYREKYDY